MTSSCQTGPGQLHWQHRGRDWRGSSILEIRHPHNIAIARRQLCVEAVVAGGRTTHEVEGSLRMAPVDRQT